MEVTSRRNRQMWMRRLRSGRYRIYVSHHNEHGTYVLRNDLELCCSCVGMRFTDNRPNTAKRTPAVDWSKNVAQ